MSKKIATQLEVFKCYHSDARATKEPTRGFCKSQLPLIDPDYNNRELSEVWTSREYGDSELVALGDISTKKLYTSIVIQYIQSEFIFGTPGGDSTSAVGTVTPESLSIGNLNLRVGISSNYPLGTVRITTSWAELSLGTPVSSKAEAESQIPSEFKDFTPLVSYEVQEPKFGSKSGTARLRLNFKLKS